MKLTRFCVMDDFTSCREILLEYGGQKKLIPAGTILYDANTAPHKSYYIDKGIAKLSSINENGNEMIMLLLGQGAIYPVTQLDASLFSLETHLHLTAITDLEVITFPSADIVDMMQANRKMILAVLDHYASYCNTILCKLMLQSYDDSELCVSSFLYLYARQEGHCVNEVRLTQEQIGQLVGLSRIQVARVLKSLRDDGIIKTGRSGITILSLERLKESCSAVVDEQNE